MHTLVDVIEHSTSGARYTIPNGDPLPSDVYRRVKVAVSPDEGLHFAGYRKVNVNGEDIWIHSKFLKAKC